MAFIGLPQLCIQDLVQASQLFTRFLCPEQVRGQPVCVDLHLVVEALFLECDLFQLLVLCSEEFVLLHEDVVISLQQGDHLILLYPIDLFLISGDHRINVSTVISIELRLEDVQLMAQVDVLLANLLLFGFHHGHLPALLLQFNLILLHCQLVRLDQWGVVEHSCECGLVSSCLLA